MDQKPNSWPECALRRAIDITFAAPALLVSAPFLALAGALIKLEDGGPVFHRRLVLGRGGTRFEAYKLRTMRVDADRWLEAQPELFERYQATTKLSDDPRVTHVGRVLRRFHLDEVPQLINVLAGQMSIVGPRMIHPSELARFGEFGQRRLTVKPGITGLWQVTVRQSQTYEERVVLDRDYLDRRTIALDLMILFKSIPTMLRKTTPR